MNNCNACRSYWVSVLFIRSLALSFICCVCCIVAGIAIVFYWNINLVHLMYLCDYVCHVSITCDRFDPLASSNYCFFSYTSVLFFLFCFLTLLFHLQQQKVNRIVSAHLCFHSIQRCRWGSVFMAPSGPSKTIKPYETASQNFQRVIATGTPNTAGVWKFSNFQAKQYRVVSQKQYIINMKH